MKSPLRYQASEYDCGLTSMMNAIMFLFEREEIPPDLVRQIGQCTLDSYDKEGHEGISGTSGAAIRYFGTWLNELRHGGLLPISSRFLEKEDVVFEKDSDLTSALLSGCAIVLHVFLNTNNHYTGHYILLTGIKDDNFLAFDPYFSAQHKTSETDPFSYNQIIPRNILNDVSKKNYAMGPISTREALVIERHPK